MVLLVGRGRSRQAVGAHLCELQRLGVALRWADGWAVAEGADCGQRHPGAHRRSITKTMSEAMTRVRLPVFTGIVFLQSRLMGARRRGRGVGAARESLDRGGP